MVKQGDALRDIERRMVEPFMKRYSEWLSLHSEDGVKMDIEALAKYDGRRVRATV